MIIAIDHFDEVAEVTDGEFSELLRIMPQKNATADPDRPAFDLVACLRSGDVDSAQIGSAKSWGSRIETGKGRLVISVASYTGPALAIGDLVRSKKRINEPTFEILSIDDRHATRIICQLGSAS